MEKGIYCRGNFRQLTSVLALELKYRTITKHAQILFEKRIMRDVYNFVAE